MESPTQPRTTTVTVQDIEKGATCDHVPNSICALKPEKPSVLSCTLCMASGVQQWTEYAIALTGPLSGDLAHVKLFFNAAENAIRMAKGLRTLLEKAYPEEWKRLCEKEKAVQAAGGDI